MSLREWGKYRVDNLDDSLEHPSAADLANIEYRKKEQQLAAYLQDFFAVNLEGEVIYEAEFGLKRILNYLALDPGFLKLLAEAKKSFDEVEKELAKEAADLDDIHQAFYERYGSWLLSVEKVSNKIIKSYSEHCVSRSQFKHDPSLSSELASEIVLTVSQLFATSYAWEKHIGDLTRIEQGVMTGLDYWSRRKLAGVFSLQEDGSIRHRFSELEKNLIPKQGRDHYRRVILRDPILLDPNTLEPVRKSDDESDKYRAFAGLLNVSR
ncbi:MAG: hypothetical protein PHU71_04505 [Candidatus Gracilibacteria bacterium]|nr:hypothetical protein [Candidatus Gracilibacteria bacterium]